MAGAENASHDLLVDCDICSTAQLDGRASSCF